MIWFWVKTISPELTTQSVKYHGRKAFLSHLLSASYERICSWNALRGNMCKSWLRQTALFINYFWRSFPSLPRTSSSLQMKRCSLWLQQWKKCEDHTRFHRVKANKIKHIFKSSVIFTKFGTLISGGSAATYLKPFQQWKNFEDTLSFGQVTASYTWCIFLRHSVVPLLLLKNFFGSNIVLPLGGAENFGENAPQI